MRKLLITLSATALVSFTSLANSADVAAGKASYATCVGCHGSNGEGGVGPRLSGQSAKQISTKLLMYKEGKQVGPMTSMMAPQAISLTKSDIANISAFIAKMK